MFIQRIFKFNRVLANDYFHNRGFLSVNMPPVLIKEMGFFEFALYLNPKEVNF